MRRLILAILLVANPTQCERPPGYITVGVAWPSDVQAGVVSLEIR